METDPDKIFSLYTLNDKGEPVPCADSTEWGKWFFTHDRIVRQTKINNDTGVSTVFVGIDYSFGTQKSPAVFETMVFGGPSDMFKRFSCTWQEAKLVHAEVCHMLIKNLLRDT